MKIKDRTEFRTKAKPLSVPETATVQEAAVAMAKNNYGSVVVDGADGKMTGIFTERDLLMRVVKEGLDPKTTKLADVTTREIRTAKPDDDVFDWLRIMSNERFRRLPVMGDDGKIIAIMTQGDFVSYSWPNLFGQATAAAKKGLMQNYQIPLILGGVLLYSLILAVILE